MGIIMTDNFIFRRSKDKDCIDGRMKRSIKANFKRTLCWAKEKSGILMMSTMKEESKMVKDKGSGFTNIQMEMNLKENGKMIKSWLGNINFTTGDYLMANLKRTK